jgi:nitrate reductase gamma subunit
MKVLLPLLAVAGLAVISFMGVEAGNQRFLFGVVIPYAALGLFLAGFIYKVLKWGSSPVPFRIPTTCGQQKTLPWIKQSKIENPTSSLGVTLRMALEVLLFRSLFRNVKAELRDGPRLAYGSDKWLWLGGLAFHYSFLLILIRHLRFFTPGIPAVIKTIEGLDSFLQIGAPLLYISDVIFLASVTYLFLRRIIIPQVKYISLPADYFPLFLLLGIGTTGVMMRYFTKVNIVAVKELALGLVTFNPVVPEGIGALFFVHIFLISTLFAYFPLSKLMHLGGVFLSPTRNLANNSRMVRHINPWNYPVKLHTYDEYEEEFRKKMIAAEIPVEKEGS